MLCKVGNMWSSSESTVEGNIIILLIFAGHRYYMVKTCLSAQLGGITVRERKDDDMKMKGLPNMKET